MKGGALAADHTLALARPVSLQCVTAGAPLSFRLVWPTTADVDLFVEDPSSCTAYYGNLVCSGTGTELETDCLGQCTVPQQEYVKVGSPTAGTFTVGVDLYRGATPVSFDLYVKKGGTETKYSGTLNTVGERRNYSITYP